MKGVDIKDLKKHVDNRGWLAEFFRPEITGSNKLGQVTITTANPGIIKANHFHKRKNEWYCVIKGTMELALKNIKTNEKETIILYEDKLKLVKIPPNVSHGFKNIGKDMLFVLMYVDEPFDPVDPDTYPDIVIG